MVNSALLLASEGFLDWLQNVDRAALLAVNGSDSLFLDSVVHVLTTAITWLPLYLSLFYLVVKNHNSLQRIGLIVGCAGLCILFAGAVDDLIVPPMIQSLAPSSMSSMAIVAASTVSSPPMPAIRSASPSSSVGWCVVGPSVSPSSSGRLPTVGRVSIWVSTFLATSWWVSPGASSSAPPSISSIVASRAIGGQKADVTSQPNILMAALSVPPARFLSRCSTLRSFSPS